MESKKRVKRGKIGLFCLVTVAVLLNFASSYIYADTLAGVPNPGERILIIYCTGDVTNNNLNMVNNIVSALNAMSVPPTAIDYVTVPDGDRNGFYDNLGGRDLNNYCQVWDMRFRGDHSNQGSGMVMEDSITGAPFLPGVNSDASLFRNFLNNGGHLYIQGENEGFFGRNESVIQFLSDVSGTIISYPTFFTGPTNINTFSAGAPENLSTDFNVLNGAVTLTSDYAGGIPLTGTGSGVPLTTFNIGSVASAMDLAFMPSALTTGNGKIFAGFETNMWLSGMFDAANEGKYAQNIYDFLAACYRYNVTKTVSPSNVCVGDTAVYTICYTNTGTKDLPNVTLTDTLPSCISYVSSSVAPTSSAGKTYNWYLGNVPIGANVCITVTVRADSINCN